MEALMIYARYCISLFCVSCILAGPIGCGVKKAFEPVEIKGFIASERDDGVQSKKTPFDYLWHTGDPELAQQIRDQDAYELFVAPINLDYLPAQDKEKKDYMKRAKIVAEHLRKAIVREVNGFEKGLIVATAVEQPGEKGVTLELALTEVTPGNPATYAAAAAVPLPGMSHAVDATGSPSLAFEGRYVANKDGRVLIEFADRRIPKIRPIDFNKFTKTSPLRDIANSWAGEIARLSQVKVNKSGELEGAGSFSLIPW